MTVPTAPAQPLLAAFLNSEYRVTVAGNELVVVIGQRHPELDQCISFKPWTIITAHNPEARQLDQAANDQRHQALVKAAAAANLETHRGINHSPGSDWPDEVSLLVVDAEASWIHDQARRLDQVAVVSGQPGKGARLWLYQPEMMNEDHPDLLRIGL